MGSDKKKQPALRAGCFYAISSVFVYYACVRKGTPRLEVGSLRTVASTNFLL